MADDAQLDLVEVSPTARPPVCKILDFGKFKYETRKRERQSGGRKTSSQLKELRVRPAIDQHDLSYRLEQGKKFLKAGHKVQVVCIFRGRQMRHPEHGYNVMNSVIEQLKDVAKVEAQARMMGRRMTMLLSPLPTKPGAKAPGGKGGGGSKKGAAKEKAEAKPADPPPPKPASQSESAPPAEPARGEGGSQAQQG